MEFYAESKAYKESCLHLVVHVKDLEWYICKLDLGEGNWF